MNIRHETQAWRGRGDVGNIKPWKGKKADKYRRNPGYNKKYTRIQSNLPLYHPRDAEWWV